MSAVKRTKASVVAITETVNGQQVVPIDPLIQQFFGQQGPESSSTTSGDVSGSGFVYDNKGDIVTNAHVINPPSGAKLSNLTVIFANGEHVSAHVIGANIGADLAVIRVDNYKKLPPRSALPIPTSSNRDSGQSRSANRMSCKQTVTLGVVSAFQREEKVGAEGGGVHTTSKVCCRLRRRSTLATRAAR